MDKLLSLVLVIFITFPPILQAQCVKGNCWNGKGTFVYKSGARYEGTFHKGQIHGQGVLHFSNGNRYMGHWKNNYREGTGRLVYTNGEEYVGSFKASKFNGKGAFTYLNGDSYNGQWQNDLAEGKGTYTFVGGDRYEGAFNRGKFEGFGTMYYKSGGHYEGFWSDNKKNGDGKLLTAEGEMIAGNWLDGEPTQARSQEPNAATEQETPSDDIRNCNTAFCESGKGIFTYQDGSRYIGTFQEGQPEGEGTCIYANGDKYVGGWKDHAPEGKGIMYYKHGRVLGALWKRGTVSKILHNIDDGIPEEYVEVDEDSDVKIWAVVVGVGRYLHMPVLKYTDDDAYQIYAFLKSPQGGALPDNQIRVFIDEDANRQNILRGMRQVFLQADKNDVILFYFSGHGFDGSFIPADYDGYSNLLYHSEIKKILEKSQAKHKICFADACHSGSNNYALAARAPYEGKLKQFYDAFDDSKGGIALLMSSKKEEYSLEDQGLRQGIFSHYLIRGLKGEADVDVNKIVTIDELYRFVYKQVRSYTANAQTPVLSGEHDKNMPVSLIH